MTIYSAVPIGWRGTKKWKQITAFFNNFGNSVEVNYDGSIIYLYTQLNVDGGYSGVIPMRWNGSNYNSIIHPQPTAASSNEGGGPAANPSWGDVTTNGNFVVSAGYTATSRDLVSGEYVNPRQIPGSSNSKITPWTSISPSGQTVYIGSTTANYNLFLRRNTAGTGYSNITTSNIGTYVNYLPIFKPFFVGDNYIVIPQNSDAGGTVAIYQVGTVADAMWTGNLWDPGRYDRGAGSETENKFVLPITGIGGGAATEFTFNPSTKTVTSKTLNGVQYSTYNYQTNQRYIAKRSMAHMASATLGTPFVRVSDRQGDSFVELTDPPEGITSTAKSIAISGDGSTLLVLQSTGGLIAYKR